MECKSNEHIKLSDCRYIKKYNNKQVERYL